MSATSVITTLDIGHAYTRCVMGELSHRGSIQVLGVSKVPSEGVRRGAIVDIERCAKVVQEAITRAEKRSSRSVQGVVVALSPHYATVQSARGTVSVTGLGNEVSEDDVERVVQVARGVALSADSETIDIYPDEYIVDGYDNLMDPVGMIGSRLSVEATLIVGQAKHLSTLRKVVETAGFSIEGFAFAPLVLGSLLQNNTERQSGVAVVDLGAGQASIGLFRAGVLRKVSLVPLGGLSVTNDLSLVLKISQPVAEKIKVQLNTLSEASGGKAESLDLGAFGHYETKKVSSAHLAEIVRARLEEIIVLTVREIERLAGDHPPDRVIIAGGVAQTMGINSVLHAAFGNNFRLVTSSLGEIDDPGFNVLAAVMAQRAKELAATFAPRAEEQSRQKAGVVVKIAGWIKEFWE